MVHISKIKNVLLNISDTFFLPFCMVILTPIYINKLGIESYGMWILINSIILGLSVINIGGVDTIIRYSANYRSKQKAKLAEEVFSTIFSVQVFLLVLFGIFIWAINYTTELQYSSIFNIDGDLLVIFEKAFSFAIGIFVLKILEQVLLAYLRGKSRYDIAAILSILSKSLSIFAQIVVIFYGGTLADIFYYSLIATLVGVIFQIIYLKTYEVDISFFSKFSFSCFRDVFHFTKWAWLISIVATLSIQMDRWILGAQASMVTLGYYSVALLVFNNLHTLFSAGVAWVYPTFSSMDDNKEIGNAYFTLQIYILTMALVVSLIFMKFDYFFKIWLGQGTYSQVGTYIHYLLALLPLYSLTIVPFFILKGTNNIKSNFISDVLTLVIRALTIYFLFIVWGLHGVIVAIGISGVFLTGYLIYALKCKVLIDEQIPYTKFIILALANILYSISNNHIRLFLLFLMALMIVNLFNALIKYRGVGYEKSIY
jgi:O-antigen/teichoic acid export membrane protein